jgi:endonuclease YncB( thermonuclease family)
VILPDGMNLNKELVKHGWGWWYRKYAPGDVMLEELETSARAAGIGLWADPQPVPQWEWRKRKWREGTGLLVGVGTLEFSLRCSQLIRIGAVSRPTR